MRARGRPVCEALHLRPPRRDHVLPHVVERPDALLHPA
jgi:hypothetical protein